MANSSNNLMNPNAREAMNRFKMEAASEVGVNLKQGYNGDLTSRQAGSVGPNGQDRRFFCGPVCDFQAVKCAKNASITVRGAVQEPWIIVGWPPPLPESTALISFARARRSACRLPMIYR